MPYAHRDDIYDADTRMMELPHWIAEFASDRIEPHLEPLVNGGQKTLAQIDQSYRAFRRLQDLSQVKMQPSEYVERQIWVTPFAGEDIGWLLASGTGDMLIFASDYPHHEGTDDPIGRFERTMEATSEATKHHFYCANFKTFIGSHLSDL